MSPRFFTLLTIFATIKGPVESIKRLLDNPGFDNAAAWKSEYLPCALEEVIFPYNYPAVLPLPQQVDVSGFVLPRDGAILLAQDGNIELGGEIKRQYSCESGSERRAYLQAPRQRKWFDPQNWRSIPASDNIALPHMQRVPCDNEPVVITRKGPLSIDLEQANYLRLGQLNLAGTLITKEYLQYLLNTDVGELLFSNNEGVQVEYYRDDICGCHRDFAKLVEPICHNVQKTCPELHCMQPVLPLGSCCLVCGAMLQFGKTACGDKKKELLEKLLAVSMDQQQLREVLDYDISYYDLGKGIRVLQLLIVERNEYSESSVEFMKWLNASTNWSTLLGAHPRLTLAGRFHNPHVAYTSILIICLGLIFIMFAALLIFAHYQPNNVYLQYLPSWVYDTGRWRALALRTQLAFTHLENTGPSTSLSARTSDVAETAALGRDRFALRYEVSKGEVRERAFDNPMFGNKPTESTLEVFPTLETGSLGNLNDSEEVQELTEIKLESSTDEDSEAEIETIE